MQNLLLNTRIIKKFSKQIYNSLILYPKGLSQMSKTILAPFTHARNFISATAFAAANGILPFGNTKDVKAAWNALQVFGFGQEKSNEFYQEVIRTWCCKLKRTIKTSCRSFRRCRLW